MLLWAALVPTTPPADIAITMPTAWELRVTRRATDRGRIVYLTCNKSATINVNGARI